MYQTAVYFFCRTDIDPVASRVLDVLRKLHAPEETEIVVDGQPVLEIVDDNDNTFLLVQTDDVLSHDYDRYLDVLVDHFSEVDAAGVVNWHEGANAPDRVFTVHSTGDVPTGQWARTNPVHMRNLLRGIDAERRAAALDDYSVVTEATHWSGVPYGGSPMELAHYDVPTYDIEIGSSPECWNDPAAHEVVARGLLRIFDGDEAEAVTTVLCAGGVHVETAWSTPVLEGQYAVAHHLPNQWLVSGKYDEPSADDKLDWCVKSVKGGIDMIAVHDKLKATYKEPFRRLGERLGVPVVKHQALRRPA